MADKKSQAVEALENEQVTSSQRNNDLDEALEQTFPASDPVAATTKGAADDAPRVDEALQSILDHRNDPYIEPREKIAALRDEAESLSYRAAGDIRSRIRRNPWQAVTLAAATGFLFGLTR